MNFGSELQHLQITHKFIPYLEKNGIYQLFGEMAMDLALNKPIDPIISIHRLLSQKSITRETPKIIIMAPEHVEKSQLAKRLAEKLGAMVVSCNNFNYLHEKDSVKFCKKLSSLLSSNEYKSKGWILYDFPRNVTDAKEMLKMRIVPTHTFQLIPTKDFYRSHDVWNFNLKNWKIEDLKEAISYYRMEIEGLRSIFSNSLKEVPIRGRNFEEISQQCLQMTYFYSLKATCSLPRVVIVGPRGSRRKAFAKILAERFELIHVDLINLFQSAFNMDNKMGEKLVSIQAHHGRIFGDILMTVLLNRLCEVDCSTKGWVLTNFPRNIEDFKALDCSITPPNRIIFLLATLETCIKRIKSKKMNICSFEPIYLEKSFVREERQFKCKDEEHIKADYEQFTYKMKGLQAYCGSRYIILNTEGSISHVLEQLEAFILMSPPKNLLQREKDSKNNKMKIHVKDFYEKNMFMYNFFSKNK